jgi:hypothetical protein
VAAQSLLPPLDSTRHNKKQQQNQGFMNSVGQIRFSRVAFLHRTELIPESRVTDRKETLPDGAIILPYNWFGIDKDEVDSVGFYLVSINSYLVSINSSICPLSKRESSKDDHRFLWLIRHLLTEIIMAFVPLHGFGTERKSFTARKPIVPQHSSAAKHCCCSTLSPSHCSSR